MEITVMQGGDVFAQIFNAVSTFVRNETWHSLMQIAEIIGVFAVAIVYIKGRDLKSIGLWLLSFVLINTLLLTPKERLIITDLSQPNLIRKVDNVPLGVAFPIYLATLTGNAVARTYDAFLAQPDDLQYTQTGLLFGQRLLEHSFDIVPPSSELASNISNYVKTCLIERNMISKEFKWSSLRRSDNLVGYLSIGKPADFMTYIDETGKTVTQLDCKTAGVMIKNKIQQENSNQRTGTANAFAQKLGLDGILNKSAIAKVNSKLANVQNYFMGTSKSASDIFTQNMLVNQFRKAINSYPVHLDASATLINQTAEQSLTKMKLSHLSSYQVSGRLLPALHTVLLALMVGLFPIMVLAMFIRELAWGVVKNYLAVLFSLMMWPVMFAIFNSIMNTLQYQTLHGQGFTLQNADSIKENATTMAGVAMWLTASIPFLSFRLVTNLGQNLASAGSYLGNAMLSTTNADASQTAAGNYSWGNMQMNNYNGNKVDLNHLYRAGQSTVQNSEGVLVTETGSGRTFTNVTEAQSKLNTGINWSSSMTSTYQQSASAEQRKSEEASKGARESLVQATNVAKTLQHTHSDQDSDGYERVNSSGNNDVTSYRKSDLASSTFGSGIKRSSNQSTDNNIRGSSSLSGSAYAGADGGFKVPIVGGVSVGVKVSGDMGKQWDNIESKGISGQVVGDLLVNLVDQYSKDNNVDKFNNNILNLRNGHMTTDTINAINTVTNSVNNAHDLFKQASESNSKAQAFSQLAQQTEQNAVHYNEQMDSAFEQYLRTSGKYTQDEVTAMLNPVVSSEMRIKRDAEVQEFLSQMKTDLSREFTSNRHKVDNHYNETKINDYGVSQSSRGVGLNVSEQEDVIGATQDKPRVTSGNAKKMPNLSQEGEKNFEGAGRDYVNYKQKILNKHLQNFSTINAEGNKVTKNAAVPAVKTVSDKFSN